MDVLRIDTDDLAAEELIADPMLAEASIELVNGFIWISKMLLLAPV